MTILTSEVAVAIQDEFVQIDYETPAPTITEQITDTGKIVTVSSPTSGGLTPAYTNVLAYTNISEIYKVGQESKIKIKWVNNESQEIPFTVYDLNNNSKIDYIEWTVPYLSEQIFEITFISKAFKLNQNKNIIEDIYDQVYSQDNIWATVENNQYVRVVFEQILDNTKNITVYAKPTDVGHLLTIEMYAKNEIELIATFKNINNENTYKIYLTNLQTPTDAFDFKIVSSSPDSKIDIDYIANSIDDSSIDNDNYNLSGGGTSGWVSFNPIEPIGIESIEIEPIEQVTPEQIIQAPQQLIASPSIEESAPKKMLEKLANKFEKIEIDKKLEKTEANTNIQPTPKNWLENWLARIFTVWQEYLIKYLRWN
ncbi:MAG: hypothetical protein CEN87_393 [Parcubacteria group bacterium Licking1014_1]|nr:MAG: hypothetical protein CEN87_393 [Parcubacteria group bacterium Licking1014_1]